MCMWHQFHNFVMQHLMDHVRMYKIKKQNFCANKLTQTFTWMISQISVKKSNITTYDCCDHVYIVKICQILLLWTVSNFYHFHDSKNNKIINFTELKTITVKNFVTKNMKPLFLSEISGSPMSISIS